MSQQKVGQVWGQLLGKHGHGVQVGQYGAVAVRLGKVAVVLLGADGCTAVSYTHLYSVDYQGI